MIQLTEEQGQALLGNRGAPLRLVDTRTNEPYVLLRAAVYERLQSLLSENTVYTSAEMLDRVMAEDDAQDPQLAELQARYAGART